MSPLGNWVLVGGDSYNGGNLVGLTMANKELTQFHRLDYATAHSDVGLDVNGAEVIVMQNVRTDYIDLIPIDWNTQPILEVGGRLRGNEPNAARPTVLFLGSTEWPRHSRYPYLLQRPRLLRDFHTPRAWRGGEELA